MSLDPREVEVPVVGGHAGVTILPLLSQVWDQMILIIMFVWSRYNILIIMLATGETSLLVHSKRDWISHRPHPKRWHWSCWGI